VMPDVALTDGAKHSVGNRVFPPVTRLSAFGANLPDSEFGIGHPFIGMSLHDDPKLLIHSRPGTASKRLRV
jgi:hypothetical protein